MSTTIDQKVVEMRFDNKQFESNVKTSMSTLDKLKEKLNLTGASKGLEDINSSVKKVDIDGLGKSVESVSAKFSALQVMGVTALANITNSVVNTGKRMLESLTIAPIKQGFDEYELKMGSVQTIMASTGETLETVNRYLEELNAYADKTIYSFSDMTSNIGKFTNAGVKLEDAVKAIQGVSNEAAVSGANANEASRAMYNFAQALSAGYVKLIDWKSIENANMATVEFKNELINTALALGTVVKVNDKYKSTTTDAKGKVSELFTATSSFNESLSAQWMTTEVLVQTLGKYADETTDLGKKAFAAAQDVKTFSQLMDTLKEAVGSGWAKTFELIFGDFYQAKNLWTSISNVVGGFIDKMSDARNSLLEGVLNNSKWSQLTQKLNEAGVSTDKFQDKVKELAKSHNVDLDSMIEKEGSFEKALKKCFSEGTLDKKILKDAIKSFIGNITGATKSTEKMSKAVKGYGEIVNKVIKGNFGNGEKRVKALTAAGYDYTTIQNLVNEKLGVSVRHLSSLTDEQLKNADSLSKLSDAQLKSKGYTDDQIKALKELAKQADKTGSSISEMIDGLDKASGRELILESFGDVFYSLKVVLSQVKRAWNDVIEPISSEERAKKIYGIIESINKFTDGLRISGSTANKVYRTFKGLFAIIDIVSTVTGGAFNFALKTVRAVLGYFNMDLLDLTAMVGDAIVEFRDWLDGVLDFNTAIEKFMPYIENTTKAVSDWVSANIDLKAGLEAIIDYIKENGQAFGDWISGIKDAENIPKYLIEGFVNGIKFGIRTIVECVKNLGETILSTFEEVLGIESPSWKTFDDAVYCILGFVNGLKEAAYLAWEAIKEFGGKALDKFREIDFGKVLAASLGVGMLVISKNLINVLDKLTDPLEGIGDLLSGAGDVLTGFSKKLKAEAWEKKSKAIRNIAISIAILAASLALLVYVNKDGDLMAAIEAIGLLSVILVSLAYAMSKIEKVDFGIFNSPSKGLMSMAGTMLLLAITMKQLSDIKVEDIPKIVETMIIAFSSIVGFMAIANKVVDKDKSANMGKVGSMLIKMSAALLLMTVVIKQFAKIEDADLKKGYNAIIGISIIFAGMTAIAGLSKENASKAGSMMLKMSIALLLMIGVIKLAGQLNGHDVSKGIAVMGSVGLLFAAIIAVSKLAGENASKAGSMILKMSIALGVAVGVIKLAAGLKEEDVKKGIKTIAALEAMFAVLIVASNLAGKNANKAGTMLLMMSASLLILTGVLFIISKMDDPGLGRALGIIATLEVLFAGLIAVTSLAKEVKGTLIVMTVAISLLVIAVVALSFVPAEDAIRSTAMLSALLISFGACLALVGTMGKVSKSALVSIGVMTAVAIALTGFLVVLDALDISPSLEAVAGLSTLLLAMSASVALLGKAGTVDKSALVSIGILTAVVAGLAVILGVLAALDVQPSIEAAAALSVLLVSMSSAVLILDQVKTVSSSALRAMGVLIPVVAGIAVVLGVMSKLDVTPSIETATALSILLVSMSASMVLLASAGKIKGAALAGVLALGALIVELAVVITTIGALADNYSDLEKFLNKGIPLLESIGTALGNFLGNIVDGILTGSLPKLGSDLSDFMTNLNPFIKGAKEIDEETAKGVKSLAQTILILTASDLLSGLASFFTNKTSLSDFGSELVKFAPHLVEYSKIVSGISDVSKIQTSAEAAKALVEVAKAIPNSGGLLGAIVGNNDLGDFAEGLVPFGRGLNNYSMVVQNVKTDAIENSVPAAKALVEIAEAIPNSGGLVGGIVGNNDLGDFAEGLVPFGRGLNNYSMVVQNVDAKAVKNSVKAAEAIVEVAEVIPNSGGLLGAIVGNNDIGEFAEQLIPFGRSLNNYSMLVQGIKAESINVSVYEARALMTMLKDMNGINYIGVSSFKSAINELAKTNLSGLEAAFNGSSDKFSTIGSNVIDAIIRGMNSKAPALSSNASTIVSGISKSVVIKTGEFTKAGTTLSTSLAAGVTTNSVKVKTSFITSVNLAITGILSQSKRFNTAGVSLANDFISGIDKQRSRVKTAWTKPLVESVSKIRAYYNQFTSAGAYMVDGFCKGINENTYKVKEKAKEMAKAAIDSAKKELDEHSPSKVFYTIGMFVVDGFANGVDDNKEKAVNATSGMASAVVSAASAKLSKSGKNTGVIFAKGLQNGIGAVASNFKNIVKSMFSKFDNIVANYSGKFKYGKETFESLAYSFIPVTNNIKNNEKAVKLASTALDNYIKKIYKESSYYDQDKEALKGYEKELEKLNKQRIKLTEESKKASYSRRKEIDKEIKKLDENIKKTKENVKKAEDDISQHTKDTFENLRKSISDSVKNFIDPMSVSLETGINLFAAIDDEIGITASSILSTMESQITAVEEWRDKFNQLADKGLAQGLMDRLKDMGKDGVKYIDAFMNMTTDEIAKANELFAKEASITSQTLIDNFQNSLNTAKQWASDMQTLAKRGFSQDILESLGDLGLSGYDYVKAMLSMTPDQQAEFSKQYKEYLSLPDEVADSVIASYAYAGDKAMKKFVKGLSSSVSNLSESPELKNIATEVSNSLSSMLSSKGTGVGSAFVVSVAKGLTNNTDKAKSAATTVGGGAVSGLKAYMNNSNGITIGSAICSGMITGLYRGSNAVTSAAQSVAYAAFAAAKAALSIKSPSRKFAYLGQYSAIGFAKGLDDYSKVVSSSGEDLGNTALNSTANAISRISEIVDAGLDTNPTITPVLDLTNVETGFGRLDAMFSKNQAMSVSGLMSANKANNTTNQNGVVSAGGNVYQLTQNNYSPKALSRIDIYRQTKNQFSALKGVLET